MMAGKVTGLQQGAGRIFVVSALFLIAGTFLWAIQVLPVIWYWAEVIILFPPCCLSLGLWWMARGRRGDVPFVGY
ncbi:MAG: hypothetical protein NT074_06685 [Methanomicrobiales archaeon]|nr:hypothetical protein [Methanomicrobiales archaeon]